jgi:hypothetical protein
MGKRFIEMSPSKKGISTSAAAGKPGFELDFASMS